MTKVKLLLLAILSSLYVSSKGQSIFQDAITLKKFYNPDTKHFYTVPDSLDKYLPVLLRYSTDKTLRTHSGFYTYFDGDSNLFLRDYFYSAGTFASNPAIQELARTGMAGLGGADVTMYADALAKFIVKRTKEELTLAFFDKFKEEMEKKEFEELRILFPSTYHTLKAIDKEIYNYNAYLNLLRQSFEKDLKIVFTSMQKLWDLEKYQHVFRNNPEFEAIFKTSIILTEALVNGTHPGDALNELSQTAFISTNPEISNYKNSLRLFNLFSQSLRTNVEGKYWIQSDSVKFLYTDPVLLNIYLGLLLEKTPHDILFTFNATTIRFRAQLIIAAETRIPDSLGLYINFVKDILNKGERIDHQLKWFNKEYKASKDSIDYNDYYNLFNTFTDLFDVLLKIEKLPFLNYNIPAGYKTFVYVSKLSNETYIDIAKKNYNSAVLNVSLIIDTIYKSLPIESVKANYENNINTSIRTIIDPKERKKATKAWEEYLEKNSKEKRDKLLQNISDPAIRAYVSATINDLAIITDKYKIALNMSKYLKYGTLAANVVMAKNSDELEKTIEAIALPAGSSRIKRFSMYNVSLNTYIGPQYSVGINTNALNGAGLTTLLGISASTSSKGGWSWSLHANLFDIGALTSYRFNDQSSDISFKIKASEIFAPGAYLIGGFPKTPFSFFLLNR